MRKVFKIVSRVLVFVAVLGIPTAMTVWICWDCGRGVLFSAMISCLMYMGFCVKASTFYSWLLMCREKSDRPQNGIVTEVLLLATGGLALLSFVWNYYESQCGGATPLNKGFCDLVKGSASAFLPLLTTLISGPIILYWWIRRDKHKQIDQEQKRQEIKQHDERLLTETFSKAIEMLGEEKSEAVRLGGIYALEQLAYDNEKLHWTIMEMLMAYIRKNTTLKGDEGNWKGRKADRKSNYQVPCIDQTVKAAITVIGRRRKEHRKNEAETGKHIVFDNCNLRGADMSGHGDDGPDGHFENAYFSGCILTQVTFKHANLENAIMSDVDCGEIHLHDHYFAWTHFENANLTGVYIANSNLRCAQFGEANLCETRFGGAVLSGASLHKAKANGTIFYRAVFDKNTAFPDEFGENRQEYAKTVHQMVLSVFSEFGSKEAVSLRDGLGVLSAFPAWVV